MKTMIQKAIETTNAAKAVTGLLVNAAFEFVEAWGIHDVSDRQLNATQGVVNAALLIYVLATYKLSHKRAS